MTLIAGLLWIAASTLGREGPQLEVEAAELGIPFHRYTTKDALGRTITFYLSARPGKDGAAKLPVVLYVPGSGCQSLFSKQGERVRLPQRKSRPDPHAGPGTPATCHDHHWKA
jgi:hypothetical protein